MRNEDLGMKSKLWSNRRGSLLTEALVAATLLLVGITTIGKSSLSLRRLWQADRQMHLALDELNNQMKQLISLPETEAAKVLGELKASDSTRAAIPELRLQGRLHSDELGQRIQLTAAWSAVGQDRSIDLVGWMKVHAELGRLTEATRR